MTARAQVGWRHGAEAALAMLMVAALLWTGGMLDAGALTSVVARRAAAAGSDAPLPGSAPPRGRIVHTLKHPHAVFSVAWSPDGTQVATGGILDLTVSIWDPATGRLVRTLTDRPGSVQALAYSPDGRFLAAGRGFVARTKDHVSVDIWEAKTAALVRSLRGPMHPTTGSMDVAAVAFNPDGAQLVAAYQGAVLIYDVKTGGTIRTLPIPLFVTARPLASSPDGRTIAGGDVQGNIRIWDGPTGSLLRTMAAHSGVVKSLAYAPDGKSLASSASGTIRKRLDDVTAETERKKKEDSIRIWEPRTGTLRRELAGHTASVEAVRYGRGGKYLFSASQDRTIKIWDVAAGRSIETLKGHGDLIFSLALSPAGRHLASAGGSVVTIWELGAYRD
ncbi:MAG: WD40 repeat domain-containing protein [Candidatus Rokubacteria bacterium]|nr:WD40 repeat domain-containing protein [Candidatus Rokubacteria bacterium]